MTLGRVTFLGLAFNKFNIDVVLMMYLRITVGLIKVLAVLSVVKEIIYYLSLCQNNGMMIYVPMYFFSLVYLTVSFTLISHSETKRSKIVCKL